MVEIKDILNEKIKSDIIDLLMKEDRSFSELLSLLKIRDHGQLNYHLKILLNSGLLLKKDKIYSLDDIGKQMGVYIKQYKAEEIYPICVVCAIIFNNLGEVLLLKRGRHPYKGKWGFPGGKLRAGEKIKNCIEREVFEETGLKLKFKKCVGFFPSIVYHKRKIVFHALIIPVIMNKLNKNKKIELDKEELEDYVFIDPKKIKSKQLIPNNFDILKKIDQEEFSFKERSYYG